MPLTMIPSMWGSDDKPTAENTVQYRVQALPRNHFALIGQKPETHPARWWFVVHTLPDVQGDWHGDYATPEEALAALAKEIPDA
jgi:hypothetical protein